MGNYKYRAVSENGQIIEGYHEAQSEKEVVSMLKSNKYIPMNIEEEIATDIKDTELFAQKITKKIWQCFVGSFILC